MYTATVTLGATATSLRDLMNTALDADADLPALASFTGRVYQVTLLPLSATVNIASFGGTPETNNGVLLTQNVYLEFRSPTGNQISLDEIFLFGTGTCGVMVLVL